MALPSTFLVEPVKLLRAGVRLHVDIVELDALHEIERAPDVSGSPGTYQLVATLPPGVQETIYFANLGQLSWFRARAVAPGKTASGYCAAVQVMSGMFPKLPNMFTTPIFRKAPFAEDGGYAMRSNDTSGKEAFDDIYVLNTKTVKVGSAASPSSITKTLRISAMEFVPQNDTANWTAQGYVGPSVTGASSLLEYAVVLPKGVTITAFRWRAYRQTTSDTASGDFVRTGDTGTQTVMTTLTHSTTGWATLSASLNQLVGDESYHFLANLAAVSNTLDARGLWLEVDYTMPSYDKGY